MEDGLRLLMYKDAVISAVTHLFVSADERDWPAVTACLAPEVRIDMTSLEGGEPGRFAREDIVARWRERFTPLAAVHHQLSNHQAQVGAHEATVKCYGTSSHYLPNDSGSDTRTFVGTYELHLIRRRNSWLVDRFTFKLKYLEGNPELEGSARESG